MDPNEIHFTQNGYNELMNKGGARTVAELTEQVKAGANVPPVRLFVQGGKIWTLDNRRVLAYWRARRDIPYRWATPEEIEREADKKTSTNGGIFIEDNRDIKAGMSASPRLIREEDNAKAKFQEEQEEFEKEEARETLQPEGLRETPDKETADFYSTLDNELTEDEDEGEGE